MFASANVLPVGVELGPSAYHSFPILPSLSSYLPTLPPSLRHSCGSEVSVEILDLVPSVRFTPTPTFPPKAGDICAVCRRAAISNESVDVAQCIWSLSLTMYLIRPFPKPPKSLTVLRSVAAQIFFHFSAKNPRASPPLAHCGGRGT